VLFRAQSPDALYSLEDATVAKQIMSVGAIVIMNLSATVVALLSVTRFIKIKWPFFYLSKKRVAGYLVGVLFYELCIIPVVFYWLNDTLVFLYCACLVVPLLSSEDEETGGLGLNLICPKCCKVIMFLNYYQDDQ
jgi:hypothetical protein